MTSESMWTMRVARMACAAVSIFLHLAVGGAAWAAPDFSGQWVAEPDKPDAAPAGAAARRGDMGSGWGPSITITQDASRLIVEYAFFTRGDMQPPLKFVYALDGSETKNSVMMGRGIQEQSSKSTWDGDKLVITTTHTFMNPASGERMATEITQTLSLVTPTSLVVETMRAGVLGGAPTTTRTVYKKS
ncbi:MAG TPA: hypothetical protein VD840_09565 [Sinorhizobium sp.]|nr:hypothetical protein [Sinorhizobium sp.]